jgi:L-asparagine permease
MPLTPYSGYLTLVFLVGVVVLMAFDKPVGIWTVGSLVVIVPALFVGWFMVRNRVAAAARW